MTNGIYFKNVLRTVTTHTGTKVDYAFPRKIDLLWNNSQFNKGIQTPLGAFCDKAKIVTFAENSPMKKLGIDQVFLGRSKATGHKILSFWQGSNCVKQELMSGNNTTNDIKNYLKVIKDLINNDFKLPKT